MLIDNPNRLWTRDTAQSNRQIVLFDIRNDWNTVDSRPSVGCRWTSYDASELAARRFKFSTWPLVPAVQHSYIASDDCHLHRACIILRHSDGHFHIHGRLLDSNGRVLLLLHFLDNYWPGRLHPGRWSRHRLSICLQNPNHLLLNSRWVFSCDNLFLLLCQKWR